MLSNSSYSLCRENCQITHGCYNELKSGVCQGLIIWSVYGGGVILEETTLTRTTVEQVDLTHIRKRFTAEHNYLFYIFFSFHFYLCMKMKTLPGALPEVRLHGEYQYETNFGTAILRYNLREVKTSTNLIPALC